MQRRRDEPPLWDLIRAGGLPDGRILADADYSVALGQLFAGTSLDDVEALRGRSVLISAERQLPAILAFAELDGVARRLVLCPPDISREHMAGVMADAEVDAIVYHGTRPAAEIRHRLCIRSFGEDIRPTGMFLDRSTRTEWLLFTSGSSGRPKMVVHTLKSLTGPLSDEVGLANEAVWSTFYDVRRYGGLQILMRAFLGGGSMVLSQADEATGDFLRRVGTRGVTHISGTPSHWRCALMSPYIDRLAPRYVRLSGEVADQAILNNLRRAFPNSNIAHAFASTEAGVAFDVRDGLAGFPAALIGQPDAQVDMRVRDGSLRIRSARIAKCYAGQSHSVFTDEDGFVDTGDMVELRGDRYFFVGRREGVVNVGGLKVHPEEIEAIINEHPGVLMSRAYGRDSPITGAVVVAEFVAESPLAQPVRALKDDILDSCRRRLPMHKVPAIIRAVPSLRLTASGKLARWRA